MTSNIIIFDTETTGLLLPCGAPLDKQPKIIEFAGIKLNQQLEEVGRLEFFCHPGHPLPPEIVKITGITDAMLRNEKPFCFCYVWLEPFFADCSHVIAHNVMYDWIMLENEMKRLEKQDFTWPKHKICTVEKTIHLTGKRLSLDKAYKYFFKRERSPGSHRAMKDVEDLTVLTKELIKQGLVEI